MFKMAWLVILFPKNSSFQLLHIRKENRFQPAEKIFIKKLMCTIIPFKFLAFILVDPDPAVFLNADPFWNDFKCRSGSSLKNYRYLKQSFIWLKKHKRLLKIKEQWSLCKFTFKKLNKLQLLYYKFPCIFLFLLENFPFWNRIRT